MCSKFALFYCIALSLPSFAICYASRVACFGLYVCKLIYFTTAKIALIPSRVQLALKYNINVSFYARIRSVWHDYFIALNLDVILHVVAWYRLLPEKGVAPTIKSFIVNTKFTIRRYVSESPEVVMVLKR